MVKKISYTNKDYNALRNSLETLAKDLSGEKWTDFRHSDTGVVLIELMATLGDMINYNIDRQALETYLPTAEEKKNIRSNLKGFRYKIPSYRSATVECSFSNLHTKKIVVPQYLPLSTKGEEEIPYLTIESKTISETEIGSVKCMQGEEVELSNLTESDIDSSGRILISQITDDKNIDETHIRLFLDGIEWSEIDDVILSDNSGRYFSVDYDKYDNVFLVLHPNWTDYVNDTDSVSVNIIYIRSLGEDGVVSSNVIRNINGDIYDIEGTEVSSKIEVNNPERSLGGEDPQSIENIKKSALDLIKTMWTAVTLSDYEVLSRNYSGVANALAWDWSIKHPDTGADMIVDPYVVELYIVPDDGGDMTALLKSDLEEFFKHRKVATIDLDIKNTTYYTIDFSLTAYVEDVSNNSAIETAITEVLQEFFDYKNREYSEVLEHNKLVQLIEGCHEEIRMINLTTPASNVEVTFGQYPKLGAIEVTYES